jgi:hypothetical protein
MVPLKAVRLQLGELLAGDTTTMAPVTGNKMVLIKTAFVPNENIVLADLDQADFDGSTALVCGSGVQPVGIDPSTQDQVITIKSPVGGFRWETSGLTNLPQTIYGYALMDNAAAVLLGSELLDTPILLSAVGEEIDLGSVKMTIVTEPIS